MLILESVLSYTVPSVAFCRYFSLQVINYCVAGSLNFESHSLKIVGHQVNIPSEMPCMTVCVAHVSRKVMNLKGSDS